MMKKIVLYFLTMSTLFLVSCNDTIQTGMINPPKHIFLIGFDGLSSYCINNGADMPTFRATMASGSYTVENRSVLPSSSAVNWASMFMGAGPELHGYSEWGSQVPDLPSRVVTKNNIFPDIYGLIREKYPHAELGYFYEWDGMRYLVDTCSINHIEEVHLSAANTEDAISSVVNYITTKKPYFCSIIFAEPDGVGHGIGWESEAYFSNINHLDKALTKIFKAIQSAGIMDESIIILSSDHGGAGKAHGGKQMKEMQTPIVISGKGIKKGHQISQSTMVYDIAATIAHIAGVEQPQVWVARPILDAFETK